MSAKDAVKAREDAKRRPVAEPVEVKKPKKAKPVETDIERIEWKPPADWVTDEVTLGDDS